ncbi:short-chain dehydrogenase, partial [Myxococcota bacterium]|nr:short-chain dehydrogenase [Myxococcota bacterium]
MLATADALPDLSGRTYLITGANSGLGYFTALGLGKKGARVIMACRNPAKAA